jgi:hypothetical protein
VHPPDRPVRGEPALTGQPPPRRVRRPGDTRDDRGTDTAANPAGGILAFHVVIIPASGSRLAQPRGRCRLTASPRSDTARTTHHTP